MMLSDSDKTDLDDVDLKMGHKVSASKAMFTSILVHLNLNLHCYSWMSKGATNPNSDLQI
jgi:hypothetical protein